jgi:hypothetical protein
MVNCGVFFEVLAEYLNVIYKSCCFKGLIGGNNDDHHHCVARINDVDQTIIGKYKITENECI